MKALSVRRTMDGIDKPLEIFGKIRQYNAENIFACIRLIATQGENFGTKNVPVRQARFSHRVHSIGKQ